MNDHFSMKEIDKNLVDLTHTISPDITVWPGDSSPDFTRLSDTEEDNPQLSEFKMNAHTGTHVDAIRHFVEGGTSVDRMPLSKYCGRAVLWRRNKKPRGEEITLEEVQKADLGLEEDDIFVLDTKIHQYMGSGKFIEYFPTPEIALLEWLIEKGIKAYGTDAPGIDQVGSEKSEKHRALLSEDVPVMENLANLNKITQNQYFVLMALPLKLKDFDGSPCRAIAIT